MKKNELPQDIKFECTLKIEAAGGDDSVPRFNMVAYTGGEMIIAGFDHPVVVDLAGLSIERQNLPIRLDHNARQGVGHTERVAIEGGIVSAEGLISRDTSWARDVIRSGKNGFPWQASIGARIIEAEFIPPGNQVQVNGRTFAGPLYVVRKSILKEISFVDSGADTNTSVKVAAKAREEEQVQEKNQDEKVAEESVTKTETPTENEVQHEKEQEPQPEQTVPEKIEAQAPKQPDPVAQMRQRIAIETRRIQAIRQICNGEYPEIEANAIESGWDTSRCELEVLRAARPKAPAVKTSTPQLDRNILLATAALAGQADEAVMLKAYGERALNEADRYRGIGIQEFFRLCARAEGRELPHFAGTGTDFIQAAFSTLSLPGILSNVANKMLLEGYNYVEDVWWQICKIATVSDFKQHTRYRLTDDFKFQKVGADGELKHGKVGEQTFSNQADTHGIMFSLTRQTIINDDLAAFMDVPRRLGMGAAEAIAEAVWALLLSNPGSFFSSGNKNYAAGADTALSIDGLTAAELLFLDQTKPNGRPLAIAPRYLLVPNALKVQAQLLMSSLKLNETTTANKPKPVDNPHAGKFEVAVSSYLGNAAFTGNSTKAWYLFADPNRLAALEVAFLNGVDRPTVERAEADFNTLGIQFRGFIDFGVREQDPRGCVKMKGEA